MLILLTVLAGFVINYLFFPPTACLECERRKRDENKRLYDEALKQGQMQDENNLDDL